MPSQRRTWDGIPVLRDFENLSKVIASLQALITFSAGRNDLKEQIEIVQDYTRKLEKSRQPIPSSMAVTAASFTTPPTKPIKIDNQRKTAYARYLEDCYYYGEIIPFSKWDPERWMVIESNYLGGYSSGERR